MGIIQAAGNIAGSFTTALGQYYQGKQAKAAGNYNAALLTRDAADVKRAADVQETNLRDRVRRFISSQVASAGSSGLQVGGGPADAFTEETARLGEQDALVIRYAGERDSIALLAQAEAERVQGANAYKMALLGAATSLISLGGSGGAQAVNYYRDRAATRRANAGATGAGGGALGTVGGTSDYAFSSGGYEGWY
jgi:hypothetical protein